MRLFIVLGVGMMVYKRISVRKTSTGYSVCVHVRDGELVKPLYRGIQRFFVEADKVLNNQRDLSDDVDVEEFISSVKKARVLDG